jgi:cytochrome c5
MNKQIYKKNLSLLRNPVVTVASIGIIALSLLGAAGCTEKKATSGKESSLEAVTERIKPIGKINVVAATEETTEVEDTASAPEEEAQAEPAVEAQITDNTNEKPSPAENGKENPLTRGKAVVENNCAPCHSGNLPGAPVLGNPADWTTRLSQGKETLVEHVINGYNAMPPKGGNPSLSNEDIAAAVTYIISQVKQ